MNREITEGSLSTKGLNPFSPAPGEGIGRSMMMSSKSDGISKAVMENYYRRLEIKKHIANMLIQDGWKATKKPDVYEKELRSGLFIVKLLKYRLGLYKVIGREHVCAGIAPYKHIRIIDKQFKLDSGIIIPFRT